MNATAHGDFETRSGVDLKEVGLHNYARHPSTDVWCLSWAIGDMEPAVWTPMDPPPAALVDHVALGGKFVAHNAPFELEIWNEICATRYGFPALRPEQVECTMAQCYAMSLPGALEDAAIAMGLHMLKDAEGRALMLRMSRPRKRNEDGTFVWWDEADKIARLHAYCQQDVRVERELHARLMPLSERERRVWLADNRINTRGVHIDVPSIVGASDAIDALKERYDSEIAAVTGNAVTSVGAIAALKEWATANGVPLETVAKADLAETIASIPDGDVKDALVIRQEAGKASTAKLNVMLSIVDNTDDRMRGLYQYHGANTGRWAGRKVQPHNLTRDVPKERDVEQILEWFRQGADGLDSIDLVYGPPLTALSRCLRPLFTAKPGHVLIGGDWSNVEGRGVAWFCGEQWKLDAFVAADEGRGPGLYEVAAAKILGIPVESIMNPSKERQTGKVCELAFGYQGGVGSARNFGAKDPEAVIQEWKRGWRAAHPLVTRTWPALQTAAINAVLNPGVKYTAGYAGRNVTFKVVGSFLWCLLPSGRALCYPYPKILDGKFGSQLTYMTQPGPDDRRKGRIIFDERNSGSWARVSTYGGSLLENIVQAFCRDFLADLILWCEDRGYPVVIHTHDDCYVEVPICAAEEVRIEMEEKMNTTTEWAAGFPLKADVETTTRYGL